MTTHNNNDDLYWIPDDTLCWRVAHVSHEEAITSKYDRVYGHTFVEVHDLITLNHLNDAVILHILRERYAKRIIYTQAADVLLSINPYCDVSHLYATEMKDAVFRSALDEPHPYVVAHRAYDGIVKCAKSQCVLISGESGAGKTEATKIVLDYLSYVSHKVSNEIVTSTTRMHDKVLRANPILEAFGNAQTIRNNNSSRFGKWMVVLYDEHDHHITGAAIKHFLLEKSRVTSQAPGERNFHIFHQFSAACQAKTPLCSSYDLPNDCVYARNRVIDGVDDLRQFQETIDCLRALDFSDTDIASILELVAAVLVLGNISVVRKSDDNADEFGDIEDEDDALTTVSKWLGVPSSLLKRAMCGREQRAGRRHSTVYIRFSVSRVGRVRDALAKHLYDVLFSWLVHEINCGLQTQVSVVSPTTNGNMNREAPLAVGILDIFGFEIFNTNHLEQLFINYANEKLQKHFNNHLAEVELSIFREEGLSLDVTFTSNDLCLVLFESPRRGIIHILEDELRMPKCSDKTLLSRLHREHSMHSHYTKPRIDRDDFVIKHYAGKVTYSVLGFLSTNSDKLEIGALDLMRSSQKKFVSRLFDSVQVAPGAGLTTPEASPAPKRSKRRRGVRSPPTFATTASSTSPTGEAHKGTKTLGTQFKSELATLIQEIESMSPHFIRCFKPNGKQVPDDFVSVEVLEQLRLSGVPSVVSIRQQALPVRLVHKEFLARFACLCHELVFPTYPVDRASLPKPPTKRSASKELPPHLAWKGRLRAATATVRQQQRSKAHGVEEARKPPTTSLLDDPIHSHSVMNSVLEALSVRISSDTALIGATRVFLNQQIMDRLLAQQRQTLTASATVLQCRWRCRRALRHLERLRHELQMSMATLIQATYRKFVCRRKYLKDRDMRRACATLQATIRSVQAQKHAKELRRQCHAALTLQKWWRETSVRLMQRKAENHHESSVIVVSDHRRNNYRGDDHHFDDFRMLQRTTAFNAVRSCCKRACEFHVKLLDFDVARVCLMVVFTVVQLMGVLMFLLLLAHSVVLLCNRGVRQLPGFGALVVAFIVFTYWLCLSGPDVLYAVNKLRKEWFRRDPTHLMQLLTRVNFRDHLVFGLLGFLVFTVPVIVLLISSIVNRSLLIGTHHAIIGAMCGALPCVFVYLGARYYLKWKRYKPLTYPVLLVCTLSVAYVFALTTIAAMVGVGQSVVLCVFVLTTAPVLIRHTNSILTRLQDALASTSQYRVALDDDDHTAQHQHQQQQQRSSTACWKANVARVALVLLCVTCVGVFVIVVSSIGMHNTDFVKQSPHIPKVSTVFPTYDKVADVSALELAMVARSVHVDEQGSVLNATSWRVSMFAPGGGVVSDEFYHADTHTSIVAVRGPRTSNDVVVAVAVYLEEIMFDLCLPLYVFPNRVRNSLVAALGVSRWLLTPSHDPLYNELLQQSHKLVADRSAVVFTGYALGGVYAKVVASKVKAPALAFSSPRTYNDDSGTVTVRSDRDHFASLGTHHGLSSQTFVPCDSNAVECHSIGHVICALWSSLVDDSWSHLQQPPPC